MNNYKKYLDKAKKDLDSKKQEVSKQDKDFKELYKQYNLKYASGGKVGSGERFADLKEKLSHEKGVTDPGALAASIGRKKYGNKKMESMAHKHMANGGPVDQAGPMISVSSHDSMNSQPEVNESEMRDPTQAQPSQQEEYQAKDYPGKGGYSSAGPESRMANGGTAVMPTSNPKVTPYTNPGNRSQGMKDKEKSPFHFNQGGDLKVGTQSESPSYYSNGGPVYSKGQYKNEDISDKGLKKFLSTIPNYDHGTPDAEKSTLEYLSDKFRQAYGDPNPTPTPAPSRDEQYEKINQQNAQDFAPGSHTYSSRHGYANGSPDVMSDSDSDMQAKAKKYGWTPEHVAYLKSLRNDIPQAPTQAPGQPMGNQDPNIMPTGIDQGINLNPQAAQNVAQAFASGGMVKKHDDMYKQFLHLYGGLPAVPKLENPLAAVHAPSDKKYPLNIPRGAKMHFPKRLKSINSISGFADGSPGIAAPAPMAAPSMAVAPAPVKMPNMGASANTATSVAPMLKNTYAGVPKKKKLKFADGTGDVPADNSMDMGDIPVDSGPYPGEEQNAQNAVDTSTQGQLQQDIDSHNQGQQVLQQIDKALGKPANDEDYPKIEMPSGRKPLLPMSDEGDSSDEQHDKEVVSKEDADTVNKLGKEDTDATKVSDQTTEAQLDKEDSGDQDKKKTDEDLAKEDKDKQDKQDSPTEDEKSAQDEVQNRDNPQQRLRDAQDAQRQAIFSGQIGKIIDKMGASMGHYRPQNQDIYDENIKNAGLPVQQLEQQMSMEKYDPNSNTSKSFRQYLSKFGGQDIKDLGNISAAQAADIAPMAFKQFEAKQAQAAATINKQLTTNENLAKTKLQVEEKYQQSIEHNDLMREIHSSVALQQASNKADKDKALQEKAELAASKDTNEKLFGSRQPPDVKQSRLDHINAQKGLDTIDAFGNGPKGLDGIDPQMTGGIRLEVQKIMQSGAPAEGGINHFDPNTWTGKLAEEWGKFSNSSTPANASSFLKEYQKYLRSMQDTTGSLINDYNTSILNIQKRKMNPDDYDNTINSPYVAPYNKYSKNKIPNFSQPNKQPSTTSKKTNDIPGFDPDAFLKGNK